MSNSVKNIIDLLRIRQYYKNLLIFVGIFFSEKLFKIDYYFPLMIGFILLCFTSSINYIINDIIDIERDKEHQEKLNKKPLASGELSVKFAVFLILALSFFIIFSLIFLIPVNLNFILILIAIVVTGQLYNLLFKYYAFVDILILSTGYLWRSLAGCFLIDEGISAWLFLLIFEVALFLVIAKRKGDLMMFGHQENAIKHKKVYSIYSIKILDNFHNITATSIFISYCLYLFYKFQLLPVNLLDDKNSIMILSIPVLIYIIMRYMYLTSERPDIARNTEKAFFDTGIIIAFLIMGIITLYSFYGDEILDFFIDLFKL